jgi:hypothetical protein
MAKDDDELIRKFQALISYLPVIRPAPMQPTLTHPPPWAVGVGVAQPVPTLTGPLPPWPISITITPEMFRVYDWLDQHRDQRDTDDYRARHDWLAEQMGLSPDTLEPLGSSSRAPRIEDNPSSSSAPPAASPPTEQTVERAERVATLAATETPDAASFTAEAASLGTLAAVEPADIARIIGRKKRKPGAGNKPKFTDEEIRQLRDALDRKIDGDPKQGSYKNARDFLKRHAVPRIMKARGVAKVGKTTVGKSTLDRVVIKPVRDARRERFLAISK